MKHHQDQHEWETVKGKGGVDWCGAHAQIYREWLNIRTWRERIKITSRMRSWAIPSYISHSPFQLSWKWKSVSHLCICWGFALSSALPTQKVAVLQVWCDNSSPGLLGVQTVSGLSLNDPVIISDLHAVGDRGSENDREEINLESSECSRLNHISV